MCNTKLQWKLKGTIIGIGKSLSIDNTIAYEYLCYITTKETDEVYVMRIPANILSNTQQKFRAGYYQSGKSYGSARLEATSNYIRVGNFNVCDRVYESNVMLTVYYR